MIYRSGVYLKKVQGKSGIVEVEQEARISGDGLFAIQRCSHEFCRTPWEVAHIPSGLLASPGPFAKLRQAARYVDLITPLADWKGLYVDDHLELPSGSPLPSLMSQAANDARKV